MTRRSCAIYATGIISAHLLIVGIALVVAQVFQTMIHSRLKQVTVTNTVRFLIFCTFFPSVTHLWGVGGLNVCIRSEHPFSMSLTHREWCTTSSSLSVKCQNSSVWFFFPAFPAWWPPKAIPFRSPHDPCSCVPVHSSGSFCFMFKTNDRSVLTLHEKKKIEHFCYLRI